MFRGRLVITAFGLANTRVPRAADYNVIVYRGQFGLSTRHRTFLGFAWRLFTFFFW